MPPGRLVSCPFQVTVNLVPMHDLQVLQKQASEKDFVQVETPSAEPIGDFRLDSEGGIVR